MISCALITLVSKWVTLLNEHVMLCKAVNYNDYDDNHNYIKILESDWSSAGLISAVIVQLHTSCACNCTVVRVMPE